MKKDKNLEEVFKEKFENFEVDPKLDSWEKIAAVIGVSATVTAGGYASYFSLGKIIIAASIIGSLSLGGYLLLNKNKSLTTAQNKNIVVKENPTANEIKEVTVAIQDNAVLSDSESKKSNVTASAVEEKPTFVTSEIKKEQKPDNAITLNQKSKPEITPKKPLAEKKNKPLSDQEISPEDKDEIASRSMNLPSRKPEISPEQLTEGISMNYFQLASISANPVFGRTPLEVTFINEGSSLSNKWNFGDGSDVSYDLTSTHTFVKPGTYKVILTSSDNSRNETDTITIYAGNGSFIADIPSMFTPNGDGKDDNFKISAYNLISLKVKISDMATGKEIYKWHTLEGSWNGKTPNGNMAPAGTYLYTLEAEGKDGKKYPLTEGQISIQK